VCNPNKPEPPRQNEEEEETATETEGLVGAAYIAMLLGWLSCDSPSNASSIFRFLSSLSSSLPLPPSSPVIPFSSLSAILELFLSFQLQAGILAEYLIYSYFIYL